MYRKLKFLHVTNIICVICDKYELSAECMMRNVLIKTTVYQYSLHVSTIQNYLLLNVQTRGQSAQDVALWDPQLTVSPNKQML